MMVIARPRFHRSLMHAHRIQESTHIASSQVDQTPKTIDVIPEKKQFTVTIEEHHRAIALSEKEDERLLISLGQCLFESAMYPRPSKPTAVALTLPLKTVPFAK